MTKKRTSMADIATHAGVSTATVSRVFNGVGQVSAPTRIKVLTAIDELGYDRPASSAPPSSPGIGVVVPELTTPGFSAFAHCLQVEIAHAGGIAMIRSQTPGATSEAEHISSLLAHGVDGLVFVSGRHADHLGDVSPYLDLAGRKVPFVTVNGARPEIPAPDFSTGDALGIRAALAHLRELGHTRIALLGGRTHVVPARRKARAFRAAMAADFGQDDPVVVETFYTFEAAAAATPDLIAQDVSAIVTGSDLQALGAISALRAHGLRTPEDVSVIGFDDSFLIPHLDPPLTTVRQPVTAIVSSAVRALFEALANREPQSHADFTFTPDLVVRSSTGRAA